MRESCCDGARSRLAYTLTTVVNLNALTIHLVRYWLLSAAVLSDWYFSLVLSFCFPLTVSFCLSPALLASAFRELNANCRIVRDQRHSLCLRSFHPDVRTCC